MLKKISLLGLLVAIMIGVSGCQIGRVKIGYSEVYSHSYESREFNGSVEYYRYTAPPVVYVEPRANWYWVNTYQPLPTIWIGGRAPHYSYNNGGSYCPPQGRPYCPPQGGGHQGGGHQRGGGYGQSHGNHGGYRN